MSYNPARHGKQGSQVARQRRLDPRAGKRHSDIARAMGPRGANIEDIRNRQSTPHGWRIPYFQGEDFEVYYEYLCARNGTGVIFNDDQDRVVRILSGMIFITTEDQIVKLYTGQAYVLLRGTEYELSSSGDTDAELLICQGAGYEKNCTHITQATQTNPVMTTVPKEAPLRDSRVDSSKAKMQAKLIQEARERRRQPVGKKKTVKNELGEDVPTPSGKAPLAGQAIVGVNPRPVGAGGYE